MVVLDKGARPVPVAPGEMGTRPLGNAARAAAEAESATLPRAALAQRRVEKPTPGITPVALRTSVTSQNRQLPPPQEQATRVADASGAKPVVKSPSQIPMVLAQAPTGVQADSPAAPAALKFDIERYQVEGNTLLKADTIRKVLAPYTGKQKDFGDVQRALEALQLAYQKLGWGVVQVTLPEQELERGVVRFEVTETRIGKVEVQGNEYFSEANIRRSVPSLKEDKTPNSLDIARSLRVANESAVKQSQVSLKAGAKDGEIDATIRVVDDNPRKYSLSLDNTGTSSTGVYRLGVGFQHSNLWDRDHQFTFQYITNPEHPSQVTVLGAGYHIPLYGRGDSIDFVVGYSDVDSGTVQQLFNVSGAGLIVLGRYNMNLNRFENYDHKISFGLDYKAFQNRVVSTSGAPLVPDITLHPVSVAYSGEFRNDQNALNFYTSLSYDPFEGGNDAAQSDFKASRGSGGGASAEYVIWRAGVNYQRLLPADWTLRFAANAQTTRNALVAGEQFGVGGANSVRGFNERAYSNDKGHQATVELITPDVAGKIGFNGGRLKFLAFYDTANLSRNFIQPGEQTGLGIDSIGVGLRLTYRERLSVRMDYAQVKHDGGQDSGLPNGRRNSNTFHASAVFVY
jgi:hemolysin activation/secretion protein